MGDFALLKHPFNGTKKWKAKYPAMRLLPNKVFKDADNNYVAVAVANYVSATQVGLPAYTNDPITGVPNYPWTQLVGSNLVEAGTGRIFPAVVADADNIATLDFGVQPTGIEALVQASSQAREGIVFRVAGTTSFLGLAMRGLGGVNQLQFLQVNGATTVLASYTNAAIISGYQAVLRVEQLGNVFNCYLDGVLRLNVTTAFNAASTRFGVVQRGGSQFYLQAKKV